MPISLTQCRVPDCLVIVLFRSLSSEENQQIIMKCKAIPNISVETKMKKNMYNFKTEYYSSTKKLAHANQETAVLLALYEGCLLYTSRCV